MRSDLPRMVWWQVKQVSLWVTILSCAFGERGAWTLWQDAQLTLRRSCTPPAKLAWCPLSWHCRQVASTFSAESFFREGPGMLFPSIWPFMCSAAFAASWQDTQLFSSEACGVCFMPVAAAS